MANQLMGHIDALVGGTTIILKNTKGSVEGMHHIEKGQRDGYGYLSFCPDEHGNIEIVGGKVNSRFMLPHEYINYLGLARKDEAIILGKSNYFELWKLTDIEKNIRAHPFTEQDALSLSQAEGPIPSHQPIP